MFKVNQVIVEMKREERKEIENTNNKAKKIQLENFINFIESSKYEFLSYAEAKAIYTRK